MNKLQCKILLINKSCEGVEPLSKKTLHWTDPKLFDGFNDESKGESNGRSFLMDSTTSPKVKTMEGE